MNKQLQKSALKLVLNKHLTKFQLRIRILNAVQK